MVEQNFSTKLWCMPAIRIRTSTIPCNPRSSSSFTVRMQFTITLSINAKEKPHSWSMCAGSTKTALNDQENDVKDIVASNNGFFSKSDSRQTSMPL